MEAAKIKKNTHLTTNSKTKVTRPNPHSSTRSAFRCINCNKQFNFRWCLKKHMKFECTFYSIPNVSQFLNNKFFKVEYAEALCGCVAEYKLIPKELCADEKLCLDENRNGFVKALSWLYEQGVLVKWSYSMEITFIKNLTQDEKKALFHMDMVAFSNSYPFDLDMTYDKAYSSTVEKIEQYTNNGSGWVLVSINYLTIQLCRYLS